MPRYHRVNIDGKSVTETRTSLVALLPGTFATINAADQFAQASGAAPGRQYVIGAAEHEGLGITDAVPAGHSAVGNYLEESREFAVLCVAGTYQKDTPITVTAAGKGGVGTEANAVGYSQDEVTLTEDDFVRVRVRNGRVVA